MSYLTLITCPALLWWYGLTPDTHWVFDALAAGYFTALAMLVFMMAQTFKDVLVLVRDLRSEGTTPPPQAVRLSAHLIAVAACMEIGVVAMIIQIAYAALYEVVLEKSYE